MLYTLQILLLAVAAKEYVDNNTHSRKEHVRIYNQYTSLTKSVVEMSTAQNTTHTSLHIAMYVTQPVKFQSLKSCSKIKPLLRNKHMIRFGE